MCLCSSEVQVDPGQCAINGLLWLRSLCVLGPYLETKEFSVLNSTAYHCILPRLATTTQCVMPFNNS